MSQAKSQGAPPLSPVSSEAAAVPCISIQMQLVITTAPTKMSAPVMLDGTCNQVVKAQTRMMCSDTAAFLDEYDVRTYQEVGGFSERAYITKAEMAAMKSWGTDPGITLLGFVPKAWLQPHYFFRSPYFLYPDETKVKGSTVAASALLSSMLARRVIGLARFVRTAGSSPQLMALVPQAEEVNLDGGVQEAPPGFHAVPLPFADDLRDAPRPEASLDPAAAASAAAAAASSGDGGEEGDEDGGASDEACSADGDSAGAAAAAKRPATVVTSALVAAAEALASSSVLLDKGKVRGGMSNPALQRQYAMLQALALDEDGDDEDAAQDEGPLDDLRPDAELWDASRRGLVDALVQLLPEDQANGGKRKAADGCGGGGKKKAKALVEDETGLDWAAIHAAGELVRQTMPNLKAFLKSKGLPVGGKKADLVDRAERALA